MDRTVTARIKKALSSIETQCDGTPFIFINNKGKYWMNGHAKDLISEKAIPVKDLMEWISIGYSHLKNLTFGELSINMLHLPDDNVLVFLKPADSSQRKAANSAMLALTMKEREVLRFIIKGLSNKEIAKSMHISPQTVNVHLDHIYKKLGSSSRMQAGLLGLKNGLFLPPPDKNG